MARPVGEDLSKALPHPFQRVPVMLGDSGKRLVWADLIFVPAILHRDAVLDAPNPRTGLSSVLASAAARKGKVASNGETEVSEGDYESRAKRIPPRERLRQL